MVKPFAFFALLILGLAVIVTDPGRSDVATVVANPPADLAAPPRNAPPARAARPAALAADDDWYGAPADPANLAVSQEADSEDDAAAADTPAAAADMAGAAPAPPTAPGYAPSQVPPGN